MVARIEEYLALGHPVMIPKEWDELIMFYDEIIGMLFFL